MGSALLLWIKARRRKQRLRASIPAQCAIPPSDTEGIMQAPLCHLPASSTYNEHTYDAAPCRTALGYMGGVSKWRARDDRETDPLQDFGPRSLSYKQLSIATKNFSDSELLGAGGFGFVYRGVLEDGTLVAVKCISENSTQGEKEFRAEVTIIGVLRHRNLVRLRGWCHDEGNFMLVYDYMPNGSLDCFLFNDERCHKLSWERRYSIASGLGSAMQYLHEECDNVIIHRDIKSSNVLLDERFNAKLGDFGLARQVDEDITSIQTTKMAGTRGYMAPECLLRYQPATRESDVYAFGAVLLELVSGKHVIDARLRQHGGMLVEWVWHLHSQGRVMEAVDERLAGRYDKEEARRVLMTGLSCSHPDPKARPKIRRALAALLGTVALPFLPPSKPILAFVTTTSSTQIDSSSSNPPSHASFNYFRHAP